MARTISNKNLQAAQFTLADFDGEWLAHLGRPALCGIWFVYGKSGSGKTTYTLQLCKYLCQFVGKIGYNSLEQGLSPSMQQAWLRAGLDECGSKMVLIDREPIEELRERLSKRRSPNVIVIDSVMYLDDVPARDIIALRHEFPNKLFIILGQEKHGEAKGAKQLKIKHDADIKIRVVGGIAMCETRYSTADGYGGADYVAFAERKARFNGEMTDEAVD